ncbi:leucine-rich repeat flightless-interacting protein 2 isoform X43 [Tachysurus vachellii]|uniref:leucine-rich repeat flightless-interacting protein 2 isoform X43 n=1 Tax=Tachysurus vachellii TaxID=175792 RepID=UPI00296AEB7F|nr:leucine-rich repeat flightless-interacting protein 2 isoform X43 [Tachysurus vachellii]
MASQGPGRRRTPNRTAVTPEEDALNVIAREAEARLAAKRAARAEAREIRMKELERQQKEIFQVQKKYYGLENLENKWGDIEQWMEDSERYTRHSERHVSVSDDEDCMSLGSKTSVRLDLESVDSQIGLSHTSLFNSHKSTKKKKKKMKISSDISNGNDNDYRTNSSRGSLYENSLSSTSLRSSSHTLSEYSGILVSSTRASSRASSRCASPVENSSSSVASFLRKAGSSSGLRDLDHVTVPDLPNLDDGLDRDFFEKGSSRASTLSTATLTSLGGASSRKGSGSSSVTADTETSLQDIKEIHELKDQIQDVEAKYMQSLKELKDSLSEMEEKYRKAMVSNAQFDNEKSNLMYEVDTLKDSLIELEELLAETRRECEEKSKDLEREKHAHSILQFQFNEQKETLKQSEELLTEIRQLHVKQDSFVREISDLQETIEWKDKKIGALEKQKVYSDAIRNERDELRDEVVQLKDILKKHGIVLGPDLCANGEVEGNVSGGSASSELQHGSSVLEIRLRKLVDERENLIEQVKSLKEQLEQKKKSHKRDESCSPEGQVQENSTNPDVMEMQNANRQVSDLKFKLVKSEQEVTALEQNSLTRIYTATFLYLWVTRLEGQVTRYKSAAENAEKVEDELKAEKRKLQRELRSALDKIEELEESNSHLNKRLEKIKAYRGTAASP